MSVYVDPMSDCITNAKWRHSESCHMFADTEDELVQLAIGIGLKRSWIQRTQLIHFDLTNNSRMRAVAAGAIPVDRAFLVQKLQEARCQS